MSKYPNLAGAVERNPETVYFSVVFILDKQIEIILSYTTEQSYTQ
jgi:hypothetical protein